jgi:hypothetical protein
MRIDARGTPSHTRTLTVAMLHGDARRVQVRGTVIDLRKRGLVPMAGDLQTAGVIHHMRVEAEVLRDGPALEAIRADQPHVAFEPSAGTGGECCRDPVRRIEALAGSPLDAEFARRLGGAIGGPRGCSHVLTLAQLAGSATRTALETDAEIHGARAGRDPGQRIFQRSLSLDGLEEGERGLSLSLQLADVHFGTAPYAEDPVARLARQREIRVHVDIDLGKMAIRGIEGAERISDAATFQTAAWQPRDLAFLEGHPALGGMARTLFAKLSDTPEDRPLLDALLNLAPGVIQCVPALTDHWRRWRTAATGGGASGDSGPSMMAGGGMVDSCYMWRADGHMHQQIEKVLRGVRR